MLPSPSNLLHWGWAETPLCSLCQKAESLDHWISPSKHQQPTRQSAAFRAREKSQQPQSQAEGLLATAWECQLMVDLGRQLKFPENNVVTTLGSDIFLVSETMRQVVLLELTVPLGRWKRPSRGGGPSMRSLAGKCRSRGWRSLPANLSSGHSRCWERRDCRTGKPLETYRSRKGIKMAVGQAGASVGDTSYLDTSQDLINPGWVTWARVSVVRPETSNEPRIQH